jgi:hypothetical protein
MPGFVQGRFGVLLMAPVLTAFLCTACAVSVHVGYNKITADQAYRHAIAGPFSNLTAAATAANSVCAGGSQPNQQQCYTDTVSEIASAQALVRTLRSVAVPHGFAKANSDLARGLGIFINGLIERNRGLARHSDSQYAAGQKLISQGLSVQKSALAEYPPGANITT